jgi:hypothetical protein
MTKKRMKRKNSTLFSNLCKFLPEEEKPLKTLW